MKIFSNISFKSVAAAAAVMFFASSAVYAACTTDCASYAKYKSESVRGIFYDNTYYTCMSQGVDHQTCVNAANANSQYQVNQAYNYYYAQCQSGNCIQGL